MADSIIRLVVNSQEYDQKLKRAQEGLTRYADECRKVGGTLEVVEKDTLEYVRALGQMDTVSRTATGKLAELKKTFTELSVVYKDLSKEEKQSPFGKALSSSLDQLKVRINDSKAQLDDVKNSLNGGSGLSGALDSIASKFGMNISQLTKFGSVVGVTTTALQVAKDAFFQSESGIDEWGRTVEGAKGAYNVFLDTLNNGNWSNFFENLQTAIKGGRDLYDIFDRLGSIKSNNAAAIAIVQQQIAHLRLAKQQGENVDAQLKEATARLAQLQKQSITAGKAAGSKSAFEVIRNGVNSVGGAGVNDATINYVIDRIMKNGQSEFDKFKSNYQILEKKGTRVDVIPGVGYDSQGNKNPDKRIQSFDINLLTKEQQKQYAIAKAVTEGETRIQKGIAAYAQAVQEGTASAREEFKGNRYALQGSGGGGGKKGGSGSGTDVQTYAANSITAQTKLVQELTKQWNDASEEMKNGYLYQLVEAEQKLKEMKESDAFNKKGIELLYSMKNGEGASPAGIADSLMPDLKALEEELAKNPIKLKVEIDTEKVKSIQKMAELQKAAGDVAQVVGSIGEAFNAIEDPAAKVAGTVAQAIANIALGYSQAMLTPKDPISWIAFGATGLAQMLTMISAIHGATGYALGGEIKGNSYSGDNIPIMANAGEVVLTKAMTNNLAAGIQSQGMGGWKLTTKLAGTDLLVSLERTLQKQGYGKLATWG